MKRYIALLRGINISGKNKIAMTELKALFVELGFESVVTHLNSGNVIFSANEEVSDKNTETFLSEKIKKMILDRFKLNIPVLVTEQENIKRILSNAPCWWGTEDKSNYDNLIFVLPPSKAQDIAAKIGKPTEELEQVNIFGNVIFWTFDLKKYQKANWWKKTATSGICEELTIRTANTVKKIAEL
ncbi:MAG: DUF1697 domain-containing protein [Treponema sp.]|nr:DUF1697 domain-containing protein [Treponema sp.]